MTKSFEKRIKQLAALKGVNKIAVENFLLSLNSDKEEYYMEYIASINNLKLDAKLYKWNDATVWAIRKGIKEFFNQ